MNIEKLPALEDYYLHEFCGYPSNWTFGGNLIGDTSGLIYTPLNSTVSWFFGFLALTCSLAGIFINVTLLMALWASTHSGGRQINFGKLGLINKLTINLLLADACYSMVLFFVSFSLFTATVKVKSYNISHNKCLVSALTGAMYYSFMFTSILSITSIALVRWLSIFTIPNMGKRAMQALEEKLSEAKRRVSLIATNDNYNSNNNSIRRQASKTVSNTKKKLQKSVKTLMQNNK